MTHYSYTFSNLPRVSWNPIGPVSFGCWFWSHIIDKNRLSTKPRDFIADIPCFDMRWIWANSKIVCRTLSLSLLKNQITWNSPKKLDMVFQNLKIIPILSIRSTIPICPLHWVLTSWIIWGPFSNLFWLIEVVNKYDGNNDYGVSIWNCNWVSSKYIIPFLVWWGFEFLLIIEINFKIYLLCHRPEPSISKYLLGAN